MPSWGEAAQFITALAAIGAVVMSFRNGKKIEEVHLSINSRMDQLLTEKGEASRLIGREEVHTENLSKNRNNL